MFEVLRRTLLPVSGILLMGVGAWILFVLSDGGSHGRRGRLSRMMPALGATVILIGLVMVALSDANL